MIQEIDTMTQGEFLAAHGRAITTLAPDTRGELAMRREALREVYGARADWRDELEDGEDCDDDDEIPGIGGGDALTLDTGDILAEARGYRSSLLTWELNTGEDDLC